MTAECAYCAAVSSEAPEPFGGVVTADERWFVVAGDPASTIAGALRITSRRHFIHFADMTAAEVSGFAALLVRLDAALRAVTDAERVHLVSTRDRFEHFIDTLTARFPTLDRATVADCVTATHARLQRQQQLLIGLKTPQSFQLFQLVGQFGGQIRVVEPGADQPFIDAMDVALVVRL